MLFYKLACSRKIKLYFLCVCAFMITIIPVEIIISKWITQKLKSGYFDTVNHKANFPEVACRDVLKTMVRGQWITRNFSQAELGEVENFMRKIRAFHNIPQTLQREDSRCGTVQFEESSFRALCNPRGHSPCCFNNTCVHRTLQSCRCGHCYDVRQQIHAEVSTWVPAVSSCKITTFVGEQDVCRVLRNTTIYFIGDSFMRQLYIAVLSIVRSNKPHGPLKERAPPSKIKLCDRFYRVSSECTPLIMNKADECDNTARLKRVSYWKEWETSRILEVLEKLEGLHNTWVVLGIGLREGFNLSIIEHKIVRPLLQQLEKSEWPKPIWLSAHAPGLLKAPTLMNQQTEQVLKYDTIINNILRNRGVPILDFFSMTKGVMSYDGTHYGPGVNDLKAQIFLNYILEIRSNITKL